MKKKEIPIKIQEHFKDKYINHVHCTINEIYFSYEDCDDCLQLKIKGCSCSKKMPMNFFHFNEHPLIWSGRYTNDSDLQAYILELDTFFNHHEITRYIINLHFEDSYNNKYPFYYYNFCELCSDIVINIGREEHHPIL